MAVRLPDTRRLDLKNIVQYVQSLVRGIESAFDKVNDRLTTGTFTPMFMFVNAPTYTTQLGKFWRHDDLVFFMVVLEYTGLDTTDSSSIVVGGFSPVPKDTGAAVAQLALNESSALTFAATDAVHASFRSGFDQVILTNSANTGYAYNSGKIAASGKFVLQGWYQSVL